MLSEISPRQLLCDFTYIWNLKSKQWTNKTKENKEKQTHGDREQTAGCQRGEEDWDTTVSNKISHRDAICIIENTVNDTVISLNNDRV